MDALPVGKTCRAVKLLDIRSFELKSDVHEVFDHVWKALVSVDIDNNSIVIYDDREGLALENQVVFGVVLTMN
jgi:centromere/kinetochore protein ZW10